MSYMIFKPHDYQTYAIEYIEDHPISAILLDMGLGKTVITLTAIHDLLWDRFEINRVLVIAPLRVTKETWPSEILKWDHLHDLTYSIVTGTAEERKTALRQAADVYLINRENVSWLIEESGLPFQYDMVVIDELSSFKSYQSKRFRSLTKVRPLIKRIVGLTGTPSSNGLLDLWAEFKVLDMGKRLGRFITHYRDELFAPEKRNGQQVFTYIPRPGTEDEIYRRISDITLSMRCTDYLKMPDCIMNNVPVYLSEDESEKYKELRKELITTLNGEEIDAINAAALSNKLCQMANGAVYGEDKRTIVFHDRKLDALGDLIESANGRPVLIAYWYKHDLERIRKRFNVREIKTCNDIADWNAGTIPAAVIHPASAGHGLNLQSGGSDLIWFSMIWSLELYQQTNARLWRQGQTSKTVVIQHIITKGTIDEQILLALRRKDSSQSALLEAVKAQLGR